MPCRSDYSDMPTVGDLRLMVRRLLEAERGGRPLSSFWSDWLFCDAELKSLGRIEVMKEEIRRHELLKRGFTPPDDWSPK